MHLPLELQCGVEESTGFSGRLAARMFGVVTAVSNQECWGGMRSFARIHTYWLAMLVSQNATLHMESCCEFAEDLRVYTIENAAYKFTRSEEVELKIIFVRISKMCWFQ